MHRTVLAILVIALSVAGSVNGQLVDQRGSSSPSDQLPSPRVHQENTSASVPIPDIVPISPFLPASPLPPAPDGDAPSAPLSPPLWPASAPPPAATYRFWIGSEALLWWEKAGHLPPQLVTTGFPTDTHPGALGQPNTLDVFGAGNLNYGAFGGVRLFAGGWLDPHQVIGLEASGFVLDNRTLGFNFTSAPGGNPLLALRHLDVPSGAENAFVITAPQAAGATVGPAAGSISIFTHSQLWGAESNVLHALRWTNRFRLVGLAGFRYLNLSEGVSLSTQRATIDGSSLSFLGGSVAAPAVELTRDQFGGRNQFFGGQLGIRADYYFGHFFVATRGSVALGRTNEVANVFGLTTVQQVGGVPQGSAGGLYALSSNSGHFVNQDFGVVPEFRLAVGVLLTRWLRATLGYDFLYWSRVMRAGDEIDLRVDTRQVPSDPAFQASAVPRFPTPLTNPSAFWAQGLTFGLELTF